MARQDTVKRIEAEIQNENVCLKNMDDSKLYRMRARQHLVKSQSPTQLNDQNRLSAKEMATTLVRIDPASIKKQLDNSICWRNEKAHTCLDVFKIGIVKNWRTLWRSIPSAMRREALLNFFKASLNEYRSKGSIGKWLVHYTILGIPVCREASCIVTGIGHSSLESARRTALTGCCSSLSRRELPYHLAILPTNKPKQYLDFRIWLEVYASKHDSSPSSVEYVLPAGRPEEIDFASRFLPMQL